MELSYAAHDVDLARLERPQVLQLHDDVRAFGHHAHVVSELGDAPDKRATEASPLVVKAGMQRVFIDPDVDLEALDERLHEDENTALAADATAPALTILKEELAALAALSVLITLTFVMEALPPVLTNMLIGNVSGSQAAKVLAASSLSDFFQGQVILNVVGGLGAAVSMLCAQSYGARQYEKLWIYAQTGVVASLYSLPVITIISLNGPLFLTALGQDHELARIAGQFILIGVSSLPFTMIYTVAYSAMQAQNVATPFTVASALSYVVSLPVAYFLGFHTSLGYLGIALSSIVSSVVKAMLLAPILVQNAVFRDAWPGWKWREANRLALKLWPLTASCVLVATFQSAGFNVVALLCGFLPHADVVMSGNSIASTLVLLASIPMMGLSVGGTVRVGNALGAGQPRRASLASALVFGCMLLVSAAAVLVTWLFAHNYASAYTSDPRTIEVATRISVHLLPFVPLMGCVIAMQSIFQACGAQWLCAQLNFAFLFAIAVPVGLLLAVGADSGVSGLWDGQLVGTAGFLLASVAWLLRLDWHQTAHDARLNAHVHVEKATTA